MRRIDAGGLSSVITLTGFAVMYHLPIMLGTMLLVGLWGLFTPERH